MKNRKVLKTNKDNTGIIIVTGSIFLVIFLVLIGQNTKIEKSVTPAISRNTVIATSTATSTSEVIATTTASTTIAMTPDSKLGDYLLQQTQKLATQQAIARIASSTADVTQAIKKPAPQKTYTGQDAINYIKTLPLETQKQILESTK